LNWGDEERGTDERIKPSFGVASNRRKKVPPRSTRSCKPIADSVFLRDQSWIKGKGDSRRSGENRECPGAGYGNGVPVYVTWRMRELLCVWGQDVARGEMMESNIKRPSLKGL